MLIKTFFNQKQFSKNEIGFRSFLIGIFFLASAPSLSFLFLLFPIFLGIKRNLKKLLEDKFSYLLVIAALIMITKSIVTSFSGVNGIEGWDPLLNWAGLGNWIPQFLIYFGAQIYVQNYKQRVQVSKILILGTIPIIFSCFSQYFFEWYGPYELLNGFIVWYQRARTEINQPITGLFSNPNYAGAWLSMVWPFLLTYQSQKRKEESNFKFSIVFGLSILFIIAIGLINSRGAWVGILASLPLLFGRSVLLWLLPVIFFSIISILICTLPNISGNIKNLICLLIPENILTNFTDIAFSYEKVPRLIIWVQAVKLIIQKPFFGWGAATFPIIYHLIHGEWKGHPHNLFFELSISYGLVTSIIVFIFIGILVIRTFKNIYKTKTSINLYERAWWTSTVVFLILHTFDIVYFDSRISIIFWVLLSGLRGILNQPKILDSIENLQ